MGRGVSIVAIAAGVEEGGGWGMPDGLFVDDVVVEDVVVVVVELVDL